MFSPSLLNNTEEVFYKNKSPSVIQNGIPSKQGIIK